MKLRPRDLRCNVRLMNREQDDAVARAWETAAHDLIRSRDHSRIGAGVVRQWARSLPEKATVLDLGCGHGVPITQELVNRGGLNIYAMDASPTLVSAFRERFPAVRVACERVEDSTFFARTFDGAVAWGLIFLLAPTTQRELLGRIASVLRPAGRFLFTAPTQDGQWTDISTGLPSTSLGREEYIRALNAAGLELATEFHDEGDNHYYDAIKAVGHEP